MEAHLADFAHTFATIGAIALLGWRASETLKKKITEEVSSAVNELRSEMNIRFDAVDQRFDAIDKRLESIEGRLGRVEQNHLDHLTTLHAYPAAGVPASRGNEKENADD